MTDSTGATASTPLSVVIAAAAASTPLSTYEFTGNTSPVHDPAIIRQGSTYYVFVTDAGNQSGFLPIRCSQDKIAWSSCGYVFSALPSWVATTVPAAVNIWAPDLSYFNGVYHLYYAVSSFGSQNSAIGLATSPTLDQTDPSYKWTDQGAVLVSQPGGNFNAIDPSITVDTDGSVWMSYGSFWNGIFQQQINPTTGKIITGTTYHLAQRSAADSPSDATEGASLVHKGSYYYLFTSWNSCCNSNAATDNYEIVIGRSSSVHGPFLDKNGVDMASGGGYVLLQGDNVNWIAPGGQTAYIDATGGDLIVFHALKISANYLDYLFVRSLDFSTGWPVIGNTTASTGTGLATTTTLTATPNPVSAGSSVTLSATVAAASGSTPTGTVSFYAGNAVLGTSVLNGSGVASLTNSSLAVGTYSVTAVYMGSGTNAGSTSTAVSLVVQAPVTVTATTVTLTSAASTSLQGLPVALNAAVKPNSGTTVATGTVTFTEGGNTLYTAPLDSTGKATLNTAKLSVGAHSITAAYAGTANLQASTSTALPLTITAQTGSTFTNPVSMTDTNGKVLSCPDPAIIKSQSSGVNTWYMYCTGDAHNLADTANGGLNFSHKINIFQSSDLVNWTSAGDALNSVPTWAGAGALYWAPAVKFFNNKYYLYYVVTVNKTSGTYAIGVATSNTAAGPFTDSGTPVVDSEKVTAAMDGNGTYRWVIDPDVTTDSTGQMYILFGSFNGGISVRKLSADGLTSDPSTETLIAADQRYEGGAWIQHGGYFYLLASSTNCCAGPVTGYGVFAGRATTPLGPYLDQQGKAMSDVNVGGSPVLAMNGNTAVGPGGGSPFLDESGQAWYVYHEVLTATPYYTGTTTTQRPAAIDAIDWVNGWPVVRGGYGPSDAASPQSVPVAQPGGASAYTTTTNANDAPGVAIPGLSQDFTTNTLASQWTSIHSMPTLKFTGSAVSMPTVGFDTTDTYNGMPKIPILAEATPAGDYMVEVKLSTDMPDNASSIDYAQAGLILYKDDINYLRMDLYANSDTRQVEYIKSETPEGANYPVWSATDLGPATSVSGTLTTYLRLVKRTIDGKETYTGYNSTDGTTWVRCGAWTHTLGSGASIGLYAGNRAGYNASFNYVHVTTLQ